MLLVEDGDKRRLFDAAVVEATEAIIADKAMVADSDRWFRSSSAEIDAHRDGPTLGAAGLSSFALTYARLFPVSAETSHQAWLDQTRMQLASAPLVGLIAVRDRYDRASAIAAGRAWQRLHLRATAQGLAMQPLNQPIEMIDRERRAGLGAAWGARMARLTGEDWQATFAFRAGPASQTAPASRPPAPEGRGDGLTAPALRGARNGPAIRTFARRLAAPPPIRPPRPLIRAMGGSGETPRTRGGAPSAAARRRKVLLLQAIAECSHDRADAGEA